MTAEQKELIDRTFTAYGTRRKDADLSIRVYLTDPESITSLDTIARYDKAAGEQIKSAHALIDKLTAYRAACAERYSYISTAPTVPVIKLTRQRNYYQKKVYYYLTVYRRDVNTGEEIEVEQTKYPGTQRHEALKDFADYIKSHPGIIAEKDIEKSPLE